MVKNRTLALLKVIGHTCSGKKVKAAVARNNEASFSKLSHSVHSLHQLMFDYSSFLQI